MLTSRLGDFCGCLRGAAGARRDQDGPFPCKTDDNFKRFSVLTSARSTQVVGERRDKKVVVEDGYSRGASASYGSRLQALMTN